jgi:hypothetical protein
MLGPIFSYYKDNGIKLEDSHIPAIIHAHGFLNNLFLSKMKRSIVLTDDEYYEGYKPQSGFSYQCLFQHLNKCCVFIGNSIADYEEQRTIKNHFEYSKLTSFNFALFITSGNETIDIFKASYLFKMGIICLFFKDSHSIGTFIDCMTKILETGIRKRFGFPQ